MNRKFMNQPLSRPLTPREKGIRTKYGALFVLAALTALITGVYYNKLDRENTELKRNQARFDSLYSKMDYIPDSTMEVKIARVFEDAIAYQEIYPNLQDLTWIDSRYSIALADYADSLAEDMLNEHDPSLRFKSKYSYKERREIVRKIEEEAKSFNQIIPYFMAIELWYKEIDPIAVKEINLFLAHLTE